MPDDWSKAGERALQRAALGRSEMTSHDPPTHARFGAMAGPRKLNSCCSIGTIGAQLNACQHRPNMTSQAEESKHVTPEMCAVLRYTAEHGCMAKIGEPWLGPARLLERQGLIVLWRQPRRVVTCEAGASSVTAWLCGPSDRGGFESARTSSADQPCDDDRFRAYFRIDTMRIRSGRSAARRPSLRRGARLLQ